MGKKKNIIETLLIRYIKHYKRKLLALTKLSSSGFEENNGFSARIWNDMLTHMLEICFNYT